MSQSVNTVGQATKQERPPVFDLSLECEPTDDAEERLLMVYEILLGMDDGTGHEEKTQETA